MARISLRQLLDHAAEYKYGVPAFNVNNMEQVLAIMAAAMAVDAPVILQVSRGARFYAGDIMLAKMIEAAEAMHPQIPICLHQDHGNDESTCLSAIQHGYTSVMMDGSLKADAKTPADYNYNVAITARVAEMAHRVGVSVEGELGVLGSLEPGTGEAEDGHGGERSGHRPTGGQPGAAGKAAAQLDVAEPPVRSAGPSGSHRRLGRRRAHHLLCRPGGARPAGLASYPG